MTNARCVRASYAAISAPTPKSVVGVLATFRSSIAGESAWARTAGKP
jgi:hypothetical protein